VYYDVRLLHLNKDYLLSTGMWSPMLTRFTYVDYSSQPHKISYVHDVMIA